MSNSRTRNATLNIIFAILLQIVTFFRGLILPRIIIPAYGSDLNGLISSITQFLTYISLLEAGVGSIFRASLYKPLAQNDMDGVSGIINEQKRFYRKIGKIFIFYVIALCIIYPLIAKTEIDKFYIITCILILSVSTFAEYFVSLPYVSLISADQKIRISYIVSIIYTIVNIVVSLFWISIKADIRMIYISMCVIGMLRPLFYCLYVKKRYKLSKDARPDKTALKQRWNGMVHHFAFYIHTNTDATILTIFIGTAFVSVYNVYSAIILGIEKIITSISIGSAAGLGDLMVSENKEKINKTVDVFEFVQCGITTVLYTITALMLIPFVRIYTADMTDMNYIFPLFGYVLIVAEAIYCFRCVYSTVSTNANKFKETQLGAILECVTNLIVSLSLVIIFKMELFGIALGTAVGMLVRYIFEICFLSKNVINRNILKPLKALLVNIMIAGASVLICRYIFDYGTIDSFSDWIIKATLTSLIVCGVALVGYMLFFRKVMKFVFNRMFGFLRRKCNERDRIG